MKMHRYLADWYDTSANGTAGVKYAAGVPQPVTEETALHVTQGHAEEIDVEDLLGTVGAPSDSEASAAPAAS
jgi:hypothetical protein